MRFNYFCPTRIFFGEGAINNNKSHLKKLGQKALIVTGGNSSKVNGSLKDMTNALENEGVKYKVFDQVEQNPSIDTAFKGGKEAREFGADFIISIGGGSPMDAAKAVSILAVNEISPQDLMDLKWSNQPLPNVAVPTTAGTGSEVTRAAVLTVDWAETKLSVADDSLFPVMAFLDARYMLNLPWQVTVNTAVDALSHAIEGFISKKSTLVTDLLALESAAIISQLLRHVNRDNITLPEREEFLYASLLAGLVIAQTSVSVVHALGYPITYHKGLPHGLSNGILTAAGMELCAQEYPEKVERMVKAMDCSSIKEVGELLQKALGPVNIKLTPEEQKEYAQKTLQHKNTANCPVTPTEKDLIQMLVKSNLT